MVRLIVRRLLMSVPLVFIVSVLTFVLLALTPGDPAIALLGPDAPPSSLAHLREQLGLHDPLYTRYWDWLSSALHGDLGASLFTGQPVTDALEQRLPVTLSLILGATLLTTLIGVGLGVLAALRQGVSGRAIDVLSLLGLAIPNYWLALGLVAVFAVSWRVLPATGYVPLTESPADWARTMVLPVTVLAVAGISVLAKQTRNAMLDVLSSDFIMTLRARGVPERSIVFKHGLRNAAIPVVTIMGLQIVAMLSGTVIVESVFALPGLGSLTVQGTLQHDIPVVQGAVVCFTLIVVLVNLLVDLVYGWLNPRARSA
jgi:peptide/nickel transport system permease protein